MHLVNADRRIPLVQALAHSRPVRGLLWPVAIEVEDDRGCRRSTLGVKGVGIGLQWHQLARTRLDLVFVERAFFQTGNEQFPDAAFLPQPHRMPTPVPPIEVADDTHPARIGRPNAESHAIDALYFHWMGSELFISA